MPPLERVEDYLELVSAIEATAEELHYPVLLEGYEPPSDPRLSNFRITPDPGVIEVNVQPSATWDELVERSEEHTSELQSLMRISYAVFCLKKKTTAFT